ncbi:hypothetical protein QR680_014180 [Steinernema hermaphroditum]|uniref:Uncharacterized protein n=1 Tax=Steinernema hermaphroditum TaxID=289476 RepID=A0AA39M3L8_9BILA|nr:hypothetical protein QR680_014180 [Steinernema hermaphroditum]
MTTICGLKYYCRFCIFRNVNNHYNNDKCFDLALALDVDDNDDVPEDNVYTDQHHDVLVDDIPNNFVVVDDAQLDCFQIGPNNNDRNGDHGVVISDDSDHDVLYYYHVGFCHYDNNHHFKPVGTILCHRMEGANHSGKSHTEHLHFYKKIFDNDFEADHHDF